MILVRLQQGKIHHLALYSPVKSKIELKFQCIHILLHRSLTNNQQKSFKHKYAIIG